MVDDRIRAGPWGREEGLSFELSPPSLIMSSFSLVVTPLLLGWNTALSVGCPLLGVPGLASGWPVVASTQEGVPKSTVLGGENWQAARGERSWQAEHGHCSPAGRLYVGGVNGRMVRGQNHTTIPMGSWNRWTIIPMKHHCTLKTMILEARFPPALGAVSKEKNPGTVGWWFLTVDPV